MADPTKPKEQPQALVLGFMPGLSQYLLSRLADAGYAITEFADQESLNQSVWNLIDSKPQPHFDIIIDFDGATNAEFAMRSNSLLEMCGHYIYVSAFRVYHLAATSSVITEDSPLKTSQIPDTPNHATDSFGINKCRKESALQNLGHDNWTIARLPLFFGADRFPVGALDNFDVVRAVLGMKSIISETMLDKVTHYAFANDIAKALVALTSNPDSCGRILNVTAGNTYTWKEILDAYAEAFNARFETVDRDKYLRTFDKRQVLEYREANWVFDTHEYESLIGVTSPEGTGLALQLKQAWQDSDQPSFVINDSTESFHAAVSAFTGDKMPIAANSVAKKPSSGKRPQKLSVKKAVRIASSIPRKVKTHHQTAKTSANEELLLQQQLHIDTLEKRISELEDQLELVQTAALSAISTNKLSMRGGHYNMNLYAPRMLNEKFIWLRENYWSGHPITYYNNDKYFFKYFTERLFGPKHCIPLLGVWDRAIDIDFDSLPNDFVLKRTLSGGSREVLVVHKDKDDMDEVRRTAAKWLGGKSRIKARILAEPMLTPDESGAVRDFKIFVLNGKASFIQVADTSDKGKRRFTFLDFDWNELPVKRPGYDNVSPLPERPALLEQMIGFAEVVGMMFPAIRVDLYVQGDNFLIGEFTDVPANGRC